MFNGNADPAQQLEVNGGVLYVDTEMFSGRVEIHLKGLGTTKQEVFAGKKRFFQIACQVRAAQRHDECMRVRVELRAGAPSHMVCACTKPIACDVTNRRHTTHAGRSLFHQQSSPPAPLQQGKFKRVVDADALCMGQEFVKPGNAPPWVGEVVLTAASKVFSSSTHVDVYARLPYFMNPVLAACQVGAGPPVP